MSVKRTAVVTGASSGIGKALAKQLNAAGIEVFVGARRVEMMQDLKELGVHTFYLDVTKDESVKQFQKKVEKLLPQGKLHFLFNNAGQACTIPGADVDIETVNQCFDVNFNGIVRMIKAFLPNIISAKGKIVQTGSITGDIPFPWGSIYGASKAAVKAYSDSLRLELAPFEVDVVTLVTGGVDTNIGDSRPFPENSMFPEAKASVEARRSMVKENRPMAPDEYAKKVLCAVDVAHAPEHVYQGSFANILRIANEYLPRRLLITFLLRKFFMYNYYAKVRARLAKQKED